MTDLERARAILPELVDRFGWIPRIATALSERYEAGKAERWNNSTVDPSLAIVSGISFPGGQEMVVMDRAALDEKLQAAKQAGYDAAIKMLRERGGIGHDRSADYLDTNRDHLEALKELER